MTLEAEVVEAEAQGSEAEVLQPW